MDPDYLRFKRTLTSIILTFVLSVVFTVRAFAFSVEVSNAPDSDLDLILKAIQSAKKSILVNIYEFTSNDIANALLEKIQEGVRVEILQEGDPVGGMSEKAREIQDRLSDGMRRAKQSNHYYEMTKQAGGPRRFRWDHAKYIVIDGASLVIGSENYSPSGNPLSGTKGNRGWEVWIDQSEVSRFFTSLFRKDSAPSNEDLVDLLSNSFALQAFDLWNLLAVLPNKEGSGLELDSRRGFPASYDASDIYAITSPETSLSGLEKLLDEATSSIDLELMTFDSHWGDPNKRSPLYSAVVAAAQRGVAVRVLLNDEKVFIRTERNFVSKNQQTVKLLNDLAVRENIHLSARIANVKAMKVNYIHNKGALVDQDKTLISSINWNENSVERNRETAVILVSEAIHSYYLNLFEKDWSASEPADVKDF